MALTDVFPLTPSWPIERHLRDRKIRLQMDSGKQWVRSEGTDQWQLELAGLGGSADLTTLLNFYESMAHDIFKFEDKSFSPQIDRAVVFAAPPEWEESCYEYFTWRCVLLETTVA